jgi:hypothetical protein
MSTFIGTTQPNNYYIGNTALSALYVGTNKIWPVGQEIAWFDFGNTASFPVSSSAVVTNISANKNYVANNIIQYTLQNYTSGPLPLARQDPSGSGTFMPFTASVAGTSVYGNPQGTLFAITQSNFSFETWIRPYNKKADGNTWLTGPGHNEIIGLYQNWDFGINSANVNDRTMTVMARLGGSGALIISASTSPNVVDIAQWNHLVYTFSKNTGGITTFTMYKNGVLQPIVQNNITGSNAFLPSVGSHLLSVNNILGNNRFGLFDLSMMRMYNKVLDGAEVDTLFQATRARYSI